MPCLVIPSLCAPCGTHLCACDFLVPFTRVISDSRRNDPYPRAWAQNSLKTPVCVEKQAPSCCCWAMPDVDMRNMMKHQWHDIDSKRIKASCSFDFSCCISIFHPGISWSGRCSSVEVDLVNQAGPSGRLTLSSLASRSDVTLKGPHPEQPIVT